MRSPADPSAPRPVLTGRALVLGAVVVLLIVVLAAPVTRYLGSRSDVSHAAQQLHADRVARDNLRAVKTQYSDPGFLQQRIRDTLQLAMPGDTVYTVRRAGQANGIEQTTGSAKSRPATGEAWNERLWNSVRAAGR